jgi:MOSC domain-containing protein YiiM
MTGSILSIQTCPGLREPMRPLSETELLPGGIPGDKHFAPDSARQLLLIEAETLASLGLPPGAVKENVTVQGVRLMGLAPGTRVTLGLAEIEITNECHPCTRMDEIRSGLMTELDGRRGMLARVIRAGRVRPGDPVRVLQPTEPEPEVIG